MGSVKKRAENEPVAQEGDVGDGEEVNLSHYFKSADDPSLVIKATFTSNLRSHLNASTFNFHFLWMLFQTEPWIVRRRVKALKKLLAKGMQIESTFYDEISALERKYESQFQPLYSKVM